MDGGGGGDVCLVSCEVTKGAKGGREMVVGEVCVVEGIKRKREAPRPGIEPGSPA